MEMQTANSSTPRYIGVDQSVFPAEQLLQPYERPLFTQTFTLPGGYVDAEGTVHREVELAPVTGFEEELLDGIGPAARSAHAVTALLSRCLKRVGKLAPVTGSLVRDLLINDREFLMLKLRELTLGKNLRAVIVCGDPKCAQSMDIMLNLDDLAPVAKHVEQRVFKFEAGESFTFEFRLPVGADQEACADFCDDSEAAINRLLARIVLRINGESVAEQRISELPAGVLRELEQRIEELAPLQSVDLEATCVECGRALVSHLDLTSFFLNELQQNQRVLEREIHYIAWHYHWPEREILSLTRRKRRRYIELIQDDSSAALYAGSSIGMLPTNS
jgi:hypothetical protein